VQDGKDKAVFSKMFSKPKDEPKKETGGEVGGEGVAAKDEVVELGDDTRVN
jgi:hypothetical protein